MSSNPENQSTPPTKAEKPQACEQTQQQTPPKDQQKQQQPAKSRFFDRKDKDSEFSRMRALYDIVENAYKKEKARADDLSVRVGYLQADCDNIRRRKEKEIEENRRYANERLLCSLLETVDELEMALDTAKKSAGSGAIAQGIEMTLKKLKKVMEQEGVSEICAAKQAFDPSKHAAIGRVETNEFKEGTVVDEIRKGYILKEKVIRPSMVRVAVNANAKDKTMIGEGANADAGAEGNAEVGSGQAKEAVSEERSGSKSQEVNSHE